MYGAAFCRPRHALHSDTCASERRAGLSRPNGIAVCSYQPENVLFSCTFPYALEIRASFLTNVKRRLFYSCTQQFYARRKVGRFPVLRMQLIRSSYTMANSYQTTRYEIVDRVRFALSFLIGKLGQTISY